MHEAGASVPSAPPTIEAGPGLGRINMTPYSSCPVSRR